MVGAFFVLCAIVSDAGNLPKPTAGDRAAYEKARDEAGENASAHVQLALWCEARAMNAERDKHLTRATSLEPANVLAHGLLGLVAVGGKWEKPEEVKREIERDPKYQALFREYLERRIRTPQRSADAQLRLAAWCAEKGLSDEAMAHYHLVTRLNPSRDTAWIHLGYTKHRNGWVKPEELAAQKVEAVRQKHADTRWQPRLEKLREALGSTRESRRLQAERELYQIADPRAAAAIYKTFGNGSDDLQQVAVALLSQLDGPSASLYLVIMALERGSIAVRESAAKALANRDPSEVVGWFINLLHKPYKYEVRRGTTPGAPAELFVDGEKFDLRRLYRFTDVNWQITPIASMRLPLSDRKWVDDSPRNAQIASFVSMVWSYAVAELEEELQRRNQKLDQTINDDIRALDDANAEINYANGRALELLATVTGQKFGTDTDAWRKWWSEELGLAFNDRYAENQPTYTETVGQPVNAVLPTVTYHTVSCFAAGTPVQTLGGARNVESLLVGDRVLSQDPVSGALSFQPVLATTVRPGAETLRVTIDGESVVTTGIHRFWRAGQGWAMARDLKPGDQLRTTDGTKRVQSLEPGATQTVYNLSVAENRSYFVGKSGALVHDVSFVLPVPEPFDRLAAAKQKATK
jgi:hypothetical protein